MSQRTASISSTASVTGATQPSALRWVGPGVVAVAFVGMAAWSWGTWPDVLVDFGRELYLAWQIAAGKALYRDMAYYSGPLSPHVNALWFRLFGVGLNTLVWVNLAILAAFTALLYRMIREMADALAATAATLVFVLCFSFSQYLGISNYNYVCPYSHDAIHGTMLSLLALWLAWRYVERRRVGHLVASGLAVGLAFLTRGEVFLPGFASVAVVLSLHGLGSARPLSLRAMRAAIFVIAMLIPPALCLGLLSRGLGVRQAAVATMGTWHSFFTTNVTQMAYFKTLMGLDEPGASLSIIGWWTAGYAGVLAMLAGLSAIVGSSSRRNVGILSTFFLITAVPLTILWWSPTPVNELRPLPVAALVSTGAWLAIWILRRRTDVTMSVTEIKRLSFSIAALAFLGKIILNVKLFHYGFFCAMPATMLVIAALFHWLPAVLDNRWGGAAAFRCAGAGLVMAFVTAHLHVMSFAMASKPQRFAIDRGRDSFRADERGVAVRQALSAIDELIGKDETLVALPEGVMLNYLSRRVNPTPQTNWMPTEFVIFGPQYMFDVLRSHPPDWIVLVHKDTSEFGARYFGTDYGQEIMAWVRQNYSEQRTIYERPLVTNRFGMQLLKRR